MYLQLKDSDGEVAIEQLTLDGLAVAAGLARMFLADIEKQIAKEQEEEA